MAVSFTITRNTTRFHDSNGNGVKDAGERDFTDTNGNGVKDADELNFDSDEIGVYDPGDVLYTRITITNTGNEDATGVTIADDFTGSTMVNAAGADAAFVNISPIAFNDTFQAIGNTVLQVGTAGTMNGGESTTFAGNLLSNDVGNLGADSITGFQIDVVGDGTFAGSGITAKGGHYNILADGSFNYVNSGTDADLTDGDSFTYTIRDKGFDGVYNTADDLTSTATVKITFAEQSPGVAHRVWYVDSNAAPGGDGTSANPFQTLTQLNGVTGDGTTNDDLDKAGEYIYVENGAGAPVTGPITLENAQKLIGDGADLIVAGVTLATAGANSTITAASGAIVTLGNGNTIAGLNIGNDTGTSSGISGSNFGTLTVNNATINTQGQALSLTGGTFSGTGFTSTDSDSGTSNVSLIDVTGTVALGTGALAGATVNAINISNTTGAPVNTGLTYGGTVTHSGSGALLNVDGGVQGHSGTVALTGALTASGTSTGLNFENADGTYTFNSPAASSLSGANVGIDIVSNTAGNAAQGSAGSFTFGNTMSIASSGSSALVVTDSTAAINFGADVTHTGNSAALDVTNHSTGVFTFQTTSNWNVTNGTGLQFSNADGTYTMSSANVLNGGDAGIDIDTGSSGSFAFISNTSITNPTGDAFVVDNSTASVSFGGSITDNSGRVVSINEHDSTNNITFTSTSSITATAGSSGILVQNSNTGGTIAFNGQVQLTTTTQNAVTLTGNTDKTITFNADDLGLDIVTTSGTGFSATGGGTITVQGSGNTISSTTGTALEVANTNIGANDLTFVSISSNGGSSSGIILDTTGSAGGLHVTGSGSAGTGGTIANKSGVDGSTSTGVGIYLNNTADVQLAWMQLNDFSNFGIRGLQVNGFSLANSIVNATGAAKNGTSNAFDEGSISFGNSNGTNGLVGTATITNTTIHDGFENGFALFNTSGTVNLVMDNVDVNGAGNDGIVTQNFGTATVNIEVKNSEFSANVGDHFNATADGGANLNVLFGNNGANTLTGGAPGQLGGGIAIQTGIGWSGSGSANISNNSITGAVDTPINVNIGGTGTFGASIINNVIGTSGVAGSGTPVGSNKDAIRIVANGDKATDGTPDGGTLNALISGNTIQQVSGRGIYVIGRDGGTAADPIRLNVTIIGNTLRQSLTSTGQGILLESGASSSPISDYVILHADIGGAGARANIFSDDWGVNSADAIDRDEIRILHTIANNRVILTGYAGGATDDLAVRAYLAGRNSFAAGGQAGTNRAAANTWETGGTPTQPISASQFSLLPLELYELDVKPDEPADDGAVSAPAAGNDASAPMPESAPAPTGPVVVEDGVLSQAELNFLVDAAIQRWAAAGASDSQLAAMRAVNVSVSDLAGLTLGESGAGTIVLDSDAAGWRWFVDSTPNDDSEYSGSGSKLSATDKGGMAGTRIDLLTVLTHELGHQIGLSDLAAPGSSEELMFGTIGAGERRLPGSDDLAHAAGAPVTGAFAFAPITIGTIPAGQKVVVEFRHVIDAPAPNGVVGAWTGKTVVHSDQADAESNVESGNVDALTLGDRVFRDVNKNGVYDAGTDTALAGVVLTLFNDTNGNGTLDAGDLHVGYNEANGTPGYQQGSTDTPAAPGTGTALTATTAADGTYSFGSLAPGDYIVRIDSANFNAGGPLSGLLSSPGAAADPDDNVDNDDNGAGALGGSVASQAIRLDYNSEPTAGAGNDTNNTVDFGFFAPNQAPVLGALNGDAATYYENGAAIAIDVGQNVTVTDSDSANFDGGSLTLAVNGSNGDRIVWGPGATFDESNNVFVGATQIGTLSTSGHQIIISLNANANAANVQTLIRNLLFDVSTETPVAGTRTFTFTLVDGDGNDGGLGNDTGTATTTIAVVPVSDAPSGADRTGTGLFDSTGTAYAFTVADFATGLTDSNDSPANAFSGVRITTLPSASAGTLYFDSNLADATPAVAVAAGDTFTAQDLTDGKLTFVGAPGSAGTAMSFTFQVIDDGSTANGGVVMDPTPNTFSTTILAGNAAPALDLDADDSTAAGTGSASNYTEGAAAAAIGDTDVSIADTDSADDIVSATITITNPETGDKLNVGTLPATVTVDGTSTDTMVKLVAAPGTTRADFEAAIEAITFSNTGDDPTDKGTNVSRSISVVVNDGLADSNVAIATVGVADDNADAPSGTSATITAVEDTFRLISASDLGFSDPDGTFASVTVSDVTGGSLYFDADGTAGAGAPAQTLLPATFTAQDLADGKVSFRADSNANGPGVGTITFAVTDDDGNVDASPNVLTINVTAVNDSPELTTGGPIAATEQTAVAILPAASVADVDFDSNGVAGNYAGAQFSVNRNGVASTDDVFTLVAGPNFTIDGIDLKTTGGQVFATISANNPGLIVINFTSAQAPATSALVDEVIQSVRYTNVSDNPPASVDLAVGFTDGSGGIDVNNLIVNIAGVNDAPVNIVGATIVVSEDSVNVPLTGMSISDPDANPATDKIYASFQVTNGTIAMRQDVPGGIVSGDIIAVAVDTIQVYATLNQINATLAASNGLTYTPTANFSGNATLTVETNDGGLNGTDPGLSGDGTSEQDSDSRTITVTAVDDPANAQPDGLSAPENAIATGSLFANNGTGPDSDPEGDPFFVTKVTVAGTDYAPGTEILLDSGATLVVNADGSYSFDPKGKYNRLTDNSSGAVNTSALAVAFDYTVTGGDTASVAVTVQGVAGPGDWLMGDATDNTITGTPQGDFFFDVQGGTEDLSGLGGNDVFFFGATMTSGDYVDGGEGVDQIALQGNYSAGLTFGADVVGIENLAILPGNDTRFGDLTGTLYNYNITLLDVNVAAGVQMVIDANRLRPDEDFVFNGSAETDGSFFIYGGGGTDILTGGANNDIFLFGAQTQWDSSDALTGGGGIDQIALRGDYTIAFGAGQLTGIEQIAVVSAYDTRFGNLGDSYDYNLTMNDGNVDGIRMTIDASLLRSNETLSFNGSAEDDGSFRVFGGAGTDFIQGSQNGDIIVGRDRGDTLYGNGGNDVFRYDNVSESNSTERDGIQDFNAGDLIDLSRIDANTLLAGDQAFTFIGNAAFSGTAGELRFENTSSGGSVWEVYADTNGDGVSDFEVVLIINPADPITASDFIL